MKNYLLSGTVIAAVLLNILSCYAMDDDPMDCDDAPTQRSNGTVPPPPLIPIQQSMLNAVRAAPLPTLPAGTSLNASATPIPVPPPPKQTERKS